MKRLLSLRILSAVLPAMLFVPGAAAAETPVDLELAVAVDVSRSIDDDEARLQHAGYVNAFRSPKLIEAIQAGFLGRIAVGYFEWAGGSPIRVVVGWTLIDGPAAANAFADVLEGSAPRSETRTSISGAIDFARPWFDDNGFQGTRRVIDISGDGPNNWGDLVVNARDRALAAGLTINGLPILDTGGGPYSRFNIPDLDLYYRDCVIGGRGAFYVVAKGFEDFARAVHRKLVLEVAGRMPAGRPRTLLVRTAAPGGGAAGPPCDIGERLMRQIDDY